MPSPWSRLLPAAPASVQALLDPRRGPLDPPIRSELFGPARFAQHGRSLGETHRHVALGSQSSAFFPRLRDNIRVLREAHRHIAQESGSGVDVSPAAEWLLDNFHLIEAQLGEVQSALPRRYFRDLPVLQDEPLAGLPRVYGIAWAFVAHTDGAFADDLLLQFLLSYQESCDLRLGELWALPTTLRVVLIDNLRRLAEASAAKKAARQVANLCCDRIEGLPLANLDAMLALLRSRGVDRAFLAQMALRLEGQESPDVVAYRTWLREQLPQAAAVQAQSSEEQAADNLSVSNAITSLRLVGEADWRTLVGDASPLMRLLLATPVFRSERDDTRDQSLHAIERLSRQTGQSETAIGTVLAGLLGDDVGTPQSAPGHWLAGPGRPQLLRALGARESASASLARGLHRGALGIYLAALGGGTLLVMWWVLLHAGPSGPLWVALTAFLLFWPASEAVVAVVNRMISESLPPSRLPRLALADGVPPDQRVLVVIPALLTDRHTIGELAAQLERHHLANPERHAQFALLTDWVDAPTPSLANDAALLGDAAAAIRALNARHPADRSGTEDRAPRFLLLHRARAWCETEAAWIGWERKRGKLEQLIGTLAGGTGPFLDLDDISRIAPDTRHLLTLDSDTELPPGRLRDLVGVAVHPLNRPRLDREQKTVQSGYGVLQPRVVTPLPLPGQTTLYHWLFAGQAGIDPYSIATSEVYQDVFDEGSFAGKGLLNVAAAHAVLSERVPKESVLSHDLLEGALLRCGMVTDVTLVEDAPFHADVAASRLHRWTRGDWQLLPILLRAGQYRIARVSRWKIADNLRRSLVAPTSLGLVVLSLTGVAVPPWLAIAIVYAAFAAGPVLGSLAGLAPSRDDVAKQHFYRLALADMGRAVLSGLWLVAQLLQLAWLYADAVVRAAWRMAVSRRHLLQWTTAARAQATAARGRRALLRKHAPVTVVALLIGAALWAVPGSAKAPSALLCLVWAGTPFWTWWVSRARPAPRRVALPPADRADLERVARETWRLFERCVVAGDNHLPPDNLQTTPHDIVAHRTSPTNIGLYLLASACARSFGWIGTEELLQRLTDTLSTLDRLERHRGHFLNWYDTETAQALLPRYISTVDSGNLSGHLLAVAEACRSLADAPYDEQALRRALAVSTKRLAPKLAREPNADALPALRRLLAVDDPLTACRLDPAGWLATLSAAELELPTLQAGAPSAVADAAVIATATGHPAHRPAHAVSDPPWRHAVGDHIAALRSAWRDVQAQGSDPAAAAEQAARRLADIATRCETLAWAPDYAFLYSPRRKLLHIGFRVAEQQLDGSYYDLLASEARLTSLLGIAKGDLPARHWGALGRPFYAVGRHAGLRSWSGSMFEYLMPTLVLDEPHGSVLHDACAAAVREQVAYGDEHQRPWGVSECAYAASDYSLAFQYAPHGVPRLALRRTPVDDYVVAPYATALAAQVDAHAAVRNLRRLEAWSARDRYGYIEALDYTPGRQTGPTGCMPVSTFMAHHQGMTIVAIANVLLDGLPRRWGMANPHLRAVASLLQERAPREVPPLDAVVPAVTPSGGAQRRGAGLLRDVVPGVAAVEPTHLLSNGRYSVSVRANGAGASRYGSVGVTRWRDDALRDAYGSFFYVRRAPGAAPVSLTQHPAPDAQADYQSTYHADRVCFDATWQTLQSRITVWVSPEDDIEFRQVELRNPADRAIDIELLSSTEITLADPRADEAHPAFSNLFVRARWQASHQALFLERKPRLAGDKGVNAAHFLAHTEAQVMEVGVQADRLRWLGRNRERNAPLGRFETVGATDAAAGDALVPLDTGLDPVAALSVQLRIPAGGKAMLTFCTAAADDHATLLAVVDKYRHAHHLERASLMSATLMGIRLREWSVSAENYAALQTLTTPLLLSLSRPEAAQNPPDAVCDRRLLWRFGISGDRPILLVTAGAPQALGLVRTLSRVLRLWSWAGVACDVVVINSEPPSYLMTLQREIASLRERYDADMAARPQATVAGFYILRSADLSSDDLGTLRSVARVQFNADGRPFAFHVDEWLARHEAAAEERDGVLRTPLEPPAAAAGALRTSQGRFAAAEDSARPGTFGFDVTPVQRPARPWVNVLSNADFGAQVSEAGSGYTWAVNSRLNQLTAWSNDPVTDPASEWLLLQDMATKRVWNIAPSAEGGVATHYGIAHAQGSTDISHRHDDLDVQVTWCVDPLLSVKQVRLRLINRRSKPMRLRAVGIAEWIMGANRADRGTVRTQMRRTGLKGGASVLAVSATQPERSAGYGGGTAFLALVQERGEPVDWTSDRRECLDARGRIAVPDQFGQRSGAGLDPCAAIAGSFTVAPGDVVERVFLLGYADDLAGAHRLAVQAATASAQERLDAAHGVWDRLLGATTVTTPDPLFDALVNRWLLYQAVTCRLWAKAGFYQAGGAFGYRDQLQDAMALAWAAPDMLRRQIVLNASRQFPEGDVQHWWHAPTGAGVRTHFSDDLLWLPYACAHYCSATGDLGVLDVEVPFLEGAQIPEGAEDAYYAPSIGTTMATVYEHAARTIDRSLRSGAHGLPLMGVGDWNDGMNRVGHEGRGESVWLAWFLCRLIDDYAPYATARGDGERVARWQAATAGWRTALRDTAWDGAWYQRAYFDDGSPLGASANAECRIDLIAQAWSVLSGAATPERQHEAMRSVDAHLVDAGAGLVRLLDPPLADAVPSAGYIQAYPPGVRENGGQYSHAAVWAMMAQARLGDGDAAYRYFRHLSPAHRTADPAQAGAYALEPYVMAGDIYSQPPYVGRGGWSWYTGSAAWMHRAAVESFFGVRYAGDTVSFRPCLPSHWPSASIALQRDGHVLRVVVCRADAAAATAAAHGTRPLEAGMPVAWRGQTGDAPWLITLPPSPAAPVSGAADRAEQPGAVSLPG